MQDWERRPDNALAISGKRRVKSLPERCDGLGTAFNWLGRVPPAHAQFRGDDFPDIVRNGIEILLGELQAAPRASGILGLGPQRGWELAPDADLLELADRLAVTIVTKMLLRRVASPGGTALSAWHGRCARRRHQLRGGQGASIMLQQRLRGDELLIEVRVRVASVCGGGRGRSQ